MTTDLSLRDMIVELLSAYPIDPSDSLLQAGIRMEYGFAASKGRIRFAAAELAKAGQVEIAPQTGGNWRYSLNR